MVIPKILDDIPYEQRYDYGRCMLCGAKVSRHHPEGWLGRHHYGCKRMGNVQLEGFFCEENKRCDICGDFGHVIARRSSKGIDYHYCRNCAEHPLKKRAIQRGEASPFGVFVAACYHKY